MNKIALFTVFYQEAEIYLDDFFESLKSQSYKDFDILIVNDAYTYMRLKNLYPEFCIKEFEGVNRISTNREIGINYAIHNKYDYLILCDIDDYFKPKRIETSIKEISDVDIVVNDLDIVDSKRAILYQNYFSKSVDKSTQLDFEFIRTKNIFGFSNTTLRVSRLSEITFPQDLRIVDWYYFSILLERGFKVKFIPEALTEYRQHSGNMIGITRFTLDMFKNLLMLKKKHYSYFLDNPKYKDIFEEMIQIESFSDSKMQELLSKNEKQIPYPLWWQNIKL